MRANKNNVTSKNMMIRSYNTTVQSRNEPVGKPSDRATSGINFKKQKNIGLKLKKLSRKTLRVYEPFKYKRIIDMVFNIELFDSRKFYLTNRDYFRPFLHIIHFKRINCIYQDQVLKNSWHYFEERWSDEKSFEEIES